MLDWDSINLGRKRKAIILENERFNVCALILYPCQQNGSRGGHFCWSVALVQTLIADELLKELPFNFVRTFMVLRGGSQLIPAFPLVPL